MNNLFVIYIGGSHEKSLIELHDMRLIVANTIEDTYEALKKSWWGTPESLHLDAWGKLNYADGHDIQLNNTPTLNNQNKLYFVNLGGYDSKQFTELHKNIFVVAENDAEAKLKAVKQVQNWEVPHRDYLFEAEKIINVNEILLDQNIHVHLIPSNIEKPFKFTCKYVPIGRI